MLYEANTRRTTGNTLKMRCRRLINSIWIDLVLVFALIVAMMLTTLFAVLSFLRIIYELMDMLMTTLRNILRTKKRDMMQE